MHLLQRYLLLKYRSESESNLRFLRCFNSITLLDSILSVKEAIKKGLDNRSLKMPPIIEEIYDWDHDEPVHI